MLHAVPVPAERSPLPFLQMRDSCNNAARVARAVPRRTFSTAPRCAARYGVAAAPPQQHALTAVRPAAPAAWAQLMQRSGSQQQRRAHSIVTAAATAEAPEETFQYQAEVRGCAISAALCCDQTLELLANLQSAASATLHLM